MSLNDHLRCLAKPANNPLLLEIMRGLEKENLRVTDKGVLSKTKHPSTLGSALTHPSITTDFSEALLEFITRPSDDIDTVLQELEDIQRYAYSQIGDELLWVNSMPCTIEGDSKIPIASFGKSNVGRMKHIYRVGLGHRYGRSMQIIAGIHYNFSISDRFWSHLQSSCASKLSLKDFKTTGYLSLIRNFRRRSWLLLYLLGASPAACQSFSNKTSPELLRFDHDKKSLHSPHGTSLRMGDLGYQSEAQGSLVVQYNNLGEYGDALRSALQKPYEKYAAIGLRDQAQNYLQLNTHLLQIENEFYSVIRPKCITRSGQPPLHALRECGVEYVEIRCLDLNPFTPNGIDKQTMQFLDLFLVYCLLSDSPVSSIEEQSDIAFNQNATVYGGRNSELYLKRDNKLILLSEWGHAILDELNPIAGLLDQAHQTNGYTNALSTMAARLQDSRQTLSAMILEQMRMNCESYQHFGMRMAQQHLQDFKAKPRDRNISDRYKDLAQQSLHRQKKIEASDTLTFDQYLAEYYDQ